MSDDTDSPPEREMRDFQFRQMKKARVFECPDEMPKERSSLLTVSNKFGLTFVGLNSTFKVYLTEAILAADRADGNANEIVSGIVPLAEVTVELAVHHLALSCDELTLSVCGMSEGACLSLTFYDVRTFMNKARPQKLPFASLQAATPPGTSVQDLKWNPAQASTLAVCLSDGSMMILDVTDSVRVQAQLPASSGITCICWSPKGKQVAAGKMNATVSQYTPALEEKKVIPCPHFYASSSDESVKALDVLWLKTFVFAVVYAAADGSLETPPELVFISLPKKDERVETKYLNFSDTVFGSCTERLHHYFLSHVEDWDLVFAASAASIEVSVIARQDDKIWELWILEDASRAELPVPETNEDTLPLGLAIDFTSQQEIHISGEKTLPPAPTLLMLSTEGLLCPFALLNANPGVKQLVSPPGLLPLEGERLPKPGSVVAQPTRTAASIPSAPATFTHLGLTSTAASTPPAPVGASSAAPFSFVSAAPASSSSSSGFTFSVPTTSSTSAPLAFSLGGSMPFGSGSSGFSFASKPPSETPLAPSAFSVSTPSIKPSAVVIPAPAPLPQSLATASPPTVKLNLNERFSAVEAPAQAPQSFSFNPPLPKPVVSNTSSLTTPPLSATKPPAVLTPVRPVQTSTPTTVVQKPTPAAQGRVQAPQAAVGAKAVDKQPQQKKESDHIMAGILEEIAHFQKELDDLKARSARADIKVGTNEEMKGLRKESEDLHVFTLEIKETTESLHGDIGTLKTTLLEGFAGAEEAIAQSELSRDKDYRQLLYKKPLDPRSEERLKEIRRLYQYVTFAVEDVNDVLNVEWEKHLEKKKKPKHMVVPGREGLFTTLANNLYIIDQQKNRLDRLVKELNSLMLYNKTFTPATNHDTATPTTTGLESELESLRDALLKARLDTTPPKTKSRTPVKISPVKQSQLRNFLSKGQMPPVRSTAPANLSRSAFLSPKYYEDLDDVSSTSSLSQSLDPHPAHLELEEEEEEELLPELPMTVIPPALSTPRHPTVVRTPSIQPGFGAIQSTPLPKIQQLQAMGFGLSPIASPVPTNKINLSGADSTALATKTVKHGAPPSERTVPVTIPAQQAAATAALRRQMANQKTAVVSTSLTESTLKTVPQVVNVQELREKGPPVPGSNIISSSVPDPAAQVFATVSSTQAKRNPTQVMQTLSSEGFVSGPPSKTDVSVAPAGSAEQSTNKGFSFSSGSTGFGFASVTQGAGISQVKDVNKFSFGGIGKMAFGQTGDEAFSFIPKSTSPALCTGSPTLPPYPSGEAAKPTSSTTALRVEPQPPKTIGGETLGSFSGLRVGHGEEAKDSTTKPTAASFTFGDAGLGMGKGAGQFSFGTGVQKSAEDSTGADLAKVAASGSLFKPPESNTKPAFSVLQSASALPSSFSSLLAASSDSSEEPKAPAEPSEPTPPPEKQPTSEPAVEIATAAAVPNAAGDAVPIETTAAKQAPAETTPAPLLAAAALTPDPPPYIPAPAEAAPQAPVSAAPPIEATADTTPTSAAPVSMSAASSFAAAPVSQVAPAAFQVPSSDKPGSIFTHPAPATTDSSSLGITPVINTVASAATTATPTIVNTSTTSATSTVFGQPVAPSLAPAAPAITGFGSTGFGASTGTPFGQPVFGQVSGFGQPASNTGTSSGFSFGQAAFGANPGNATTGGGGGGAFGAATATNASSFSFGTSSANTASSTGSGLFGQTTAPVFGQSSGFGQGSVFGSNTTTSSSTGFGFGQPSAFGCSPATPVFGHQTSSGSVFGQQQQQSSGGSVFGSSSANTPGSPAGGGFFSGLGGKPTEEAANKNPFGAGSSTGGFGQPAQTGGNSLFGNSGAKTFGFGQPSFGEQKPGGTFSTGGGSVSSQGFGSFSTPSKSGAFGTAPVFGSPPSFGSSPAFGAAAAFGASPSFTNTMGSSAGKVFGEGTAAANMGGFGFASPQPAPSFGALANQNAPSFGNLAQQGPGFGSQPSSFSGFVQQQPQAGGFSGNTFGSSNQSSSQTFASWRS
ncbi:nuclear pore complex protein Nup214 isoform X1 [Scophthalmus maximus]|uniref:nuclear pore complex protein Nup214 isoform X1 n=2 Tax=Scophthalmus maximus TaxID=52904 RepID=UPI001FA8AE2D|nr:nuclear pore complex protein Nup214 isoform X1 [Scophthalmus maximus]